MASSDPTPFLKVAHAAFPLSCRLAAQEAANALLPFVDRNYRLSSVVAATVLGKTVNIPQRIHLVGLDLARLGIAGDSELAAQCLCSRNTDGYSRQSSMRFILSNNASWVLPFVVLLSGEYVVEIVVDMVAGLPRLDRAAYVNFVRENRSLMRALRAKATSYWNCYYRHSYPDQSSYPGLVFLHQLELWAA